MVEALRQMMSFLDVPDRNPKPRDVGITHCIDKGLGYRTAEDYLSNCSEYIDIIKFGWGTGYISESLEEKIELYHSHDIKTYFGGTLFEISVLEDRFHEYVETIEELNVDHVEVSSGILPIDHETKLEYIDYLSSDFTVLSEIGRKDPDNVMRPQEWIQRSRKELEAGAWKVIAEGRESGKSGVYRRDGEVRFGLIDEIVEVIDPDNLLFETPNKEQQVWFIDRLGTSANLGNIHFDEVVPLETLRLGLRGDTVDMMYGLEDAEITGPKTSEVKK